VFAQTPQLVDEDPTPALVPMLRTHGERHLDA